jgi:hypothetical protein
MLHFMPCTNFLYDEAFFFMQHRDYITIKNPNCFCLETCNIDPSPV